MDENTINEYINITRCCRITHEDAENVYSKDNSNKLHVHDWLEQIPYDITKLDIVEIRFKNTRKGFYKNVNGLKIRQGDIVAVEATPGHDIGVVSLTGELVIEQLKKYKWNKETEIKKVYRKAKPADVEKWKKAIELEDVTMLKARIVAEELNLNMKIGDVEYQGDGTKAIFYYIADERVDFRELIKILASKFKIRIEMRQIGSRQEAGRIGGIGTCGRELCCATWMSNFVSVTTTAARYQELSLNPQKLAGQCGKLKCCLNYELDSYIDAQKDFPDTSIKLKTEEGFAYHIKTEVYRRILWYSFDPEIPIKVTPVSVERVYEIIQMNRKNIIPKKLNDQTEETSVEIKKEPDYQNVVGQESINRFDKNKKKKKYKPKFKPENKTSNPTNQKQ